MHRGGETLQLQWSPPWTTADAMQTSTGLPAPGVSWIRELMMVNTLCTKEQGSEENTANSGGQTILQSQAMEITNGTFLAKQQLRWYNISSAREGFLARYWPISQGFVKPQIKCRGVSTDLLHPVVFTSGESILKSLLSLKKSDSKLKRSSPMLTATLSARWPRERFPHLSFGKLSHFARNNPKEKVQVTSIRNGMAEGLWQES